MTLGRYTLGSRAFEEARNLTPKTSVLLGLTQKQNSFLIIFVSYFEKMTKSCHKVIQKAKPPISQANHTYL